MAESINGIIVQDNKFKSEFDELKILGKGGFGTVYKVKNKNDDKVYAIKRVDLRGLSIELLKRETNHKYYQHQNIVEYFNSWVENIPPNWSDETSDSSGEDTNLSSFQTDGTSDNSAVRLNFHLYIQLELCEEGDLGAWLLGVQITHREEKWLSIFKQIVAAVKYIHSCGLFHRDLKPANFLFGFDGHIKLSDFGTSIDQKNVKTSCGTKKHATHTVGIGSTLYMAPEVETKNYDYRVDIYSLGVILFELITPFNTEMERRIVITKIHEGSFPNEIDDKFKPQIDLLKKMLSKNPEDRPTIANIEQCLSEWDKSPIHVFNFREFSALIVGVIQIFSRMFSRGTFGVEITEMVIEPKIEKIVSKNRPQKVKKDHKILQ